MPIGALSLLSTLFLVARSLPEESQLPFVEELRERVAGHDGMRRSIYKGTTGDGDAVNIVAETVRTDPEDPDRTLATVLQARIDYTDGSDLVLLADNGVYSDMLDRMHLTGDVYIVTSTGYEMETDELLADISDGRAESPGPVHAVGPQGTIDAGAMVITRETEDDERSHLLFTNGVKLVYQRREDEE